MPRDPDTIDRSRLRGFERVASPSLDFINQRFAVKDRLHATIGHANAWWIHRFTGKVWRVHGEEILRDLDAEHGIIVAANHRSFFDLFVCSSWLMTHHPELVRRLFFPVRSNYFYTHPLGLLMNVVLSAGSMWPPIFRDGERSALNRVGFAQLADVMVPGSLVGIHPEGKRGKGDDPYELLPARAGLGHLMRACHPETVVLPYFTLGLENDLGALLRRNRRPPGQRGETVSLHFGTPLCAGDVVEGCDALEASQRVMAEIAALGEQDRAMRAGEAS